MERRRSLGALARMYITHIGSKKENANWKAGATHIQTHTCTHTHAYTHHDHTQCERAGKSDTVHPRKRPTFLLLPQKSSSRARPHSHAHTYTRRPCFCCLESVGAKTLLTEKEASPSRPAQAVDGMGMLITSAQCLGSSHPLQPDSKGQARHV